MPRFELETLTSYDDQSLINELKRVAALFPNSKLGSTEYDRLGKVHSTTLRRRFGTWHQVLTAAGLENRFDESQEPWSREKIIKRLQSIAQRTGRNSVKKEELSEDEGPTARPISRLFGSYRAALEAAGLSQNKGGVRYTDEECYENLAVWTALGRQPNFAELKSPPSKVGPKAYINRWGSWRKALQAFIDRVNQDSPSEAQPSEIRNVPSDGDIKIKRTSRDIPLGLRYTVLKRDRFRCVIDGRSPATDPGVILHVDHIKAWVNGGETELENLRTLCSDCNLGKGCREEDPAT